MIVGDSDKLRWSALEAAESNKAACAGAAEGMPAALHLPGVSRCRVERSPISTSPLLPVPQALGQPSDGGSRTSQGGNVQLALVVHQAMVPLSSCHRCLKEGSRPRQSPQCVCPGTSQQVVSELCSGTGGPGVRFSLYFSVEL